MYFLLLVSKLHVELGRENISIYHVGKKSQIQRDYVICLTLLS